MSQEDRSYFERRAEADVALVQKATHPEAVRSHLRLAEYYLDQVYGRAPSADPGADTDAWGAKA